MRTILTAALALAIGQQAMRPSTPAVPREPVAAIVEALRTHSVVAVTAGHVTLDLNGFSIVSGGGVVVDGISLQSASNVEVKNGSILGFSRSGIFSNIATNYTRVIGIRAIGNAAFGIDLEGFGGVIDGCTALDSVTGMRVVDNGRVVCSAGIAAGIDMSLHVVSRLLGQEVAAKTARQMEHPG